MKNGLQLTKEKWNMAVYSMGTILKKCREMKKITQEDLCDGICTASALSKMEHGKREPSYVKFASLMERMGEWPEAYDVFIGDKVYKIHELQGKIQVLLNRFELKEAKEALDELERELANIPYETIYHQFLETGKVLCKSGGIVSGEYTKELVELLKLTVPSFGEKPIKEHFLSHQELNLINNIAVGYGESGEGEKAVQLLRELKEYLEKSYMGNRSKATMYTAVLLNLVKYLGLEGHYKEALEIAEDAIDILIEVGKTFYVATLHYDIAWIYMKMDKKRYQQQIQDALLLSLYADLSNHNYHSADETLAFIRKNMCEFLNDFTIRQLLDVYHRMAPAHFRKLNLPE